MSKWLLWQRAITPNSRKKAKEEKRKLKTKWEKKRWKKICHRFMWCGHFGFDGVCVCACVCAVLWYGNRWVHFQSRKTNSKNEERGIKRNREANSTERKKLTTTTTVDDGYTSTWRRDRTWIFNDFHIDFEILFVFHSVRFVISSFHGRMANRFPWNSFSMKWRRRQRETTCNNYTNGQCRCRRNKM